MTVKTFGSYEVVGELGRGGMGVVYRAKDADLGREVAVKVLSDALANETAVVERFKREARSMAALNHPNIVQVHFIGEDDGKPFIVMEFVPGESLKEIIKREAPLELGRALNIVGQTASGLAAAHDSNVVHRDVKPANLMITPTKQVKVADFGIAFAKELGDKLTTTGQFVGTPGYLSPEVCLGETVDQRSDLFSLGIVLYEMLTGRIPFSDVSPLGMMLEVVQSDVPDVREINQKVDEETSRILQRMIEKDPNARYQNCGEVLDDLERHPNYSPSGVWRTGPGATLLPPSASPEKSTSLVSLDRVSAGAGADSSDDVHTVVAPARTRTGLWAVAAALLIAIGAGGVMAVRGDWFKSGDDADNGRAAALAARVPDAPEDAADSGAPTGAELAELERLRLAAAERRARESEAAANEAQAQGGGEEATGEIAGSGGEPTPETADAVGPTAGPAEPDSNESETLAETAPAVLPSSEDRVISGGAKEVATVTTNKVPTVESRAAASLHGVLVVAIGDPAVARPVETLLHSALADQAIPVLDTEMMGALGQYVAVDAVDLPGLTDFARDQGAAAILLARIDHLGEQYISAYGTSAQLNTALLSIKAYDVNGKRSIGPALEEQINYTGMTAREQAAEAVGPMLEGLTERLDRYR